MNIEGCQGPVGAIGPVGAVNPKGLEQAMLILARENPKGFLAHTQGAATEKSQGPPSEVNIVDFLPWLPMFLPLKMLFGGPK